MARSKTESWGDHEWAKGERYKHNDLFRPGPRTRFNACVGSNGGPYGLDQFADGYFKAAQVILTDVLKDPTSVDLEIYPLVFVYRHAIELSLKNLVTLLPRAFYESATSRPTHKLTDNWEVVRSYLLRLDEIDKDDVEEVDSIIADFVDLDVDGQTFRFPSDRKGGRFLQETTHINVLVFGGLMVHVEDLFRRWHLGISTMVLG